MIWMRFDIRNERNREILILLLTGFSCKNILWEQIAELMPKWWGDQLYCDTDQAIKKPCKEVLPQTDSFICAGLHAMKNSLEVGEYDLAYDLADLMHVFPDIAMRGNNKDFKRYQKTYVYKFEKKWKRGILKK